MGSTLASVGQTFGVVQKSPSISAPTAATTSAPTTAEVSQSTTTEMDAKGIKRRRRGRSPTILTGAAGVEEGATLGTPTLLG